MPPSISVIVPIYNSEKTLRRCLDSILNQTFSDFELLLVDDNSTDGSRKICDIYIEKDERIRVFYNSKEGISLTRQFGILHALGEYTIQIDSDDWVEYNMLELLYKEAKIKDADVVMSDFFLDSEHNRKRQSQACNRLDNISLLNVIYDPLYASLWNKLIRRNCYSKYNIQFAKEIEYAEDLFIMLQLLDNPLKVEYVSDALYHYDRFSNTNSIMKHTKFVDMKRSIDYMQKHLSKSADTALRKVKRDALLLKYSENNCKYDVSTMGDLYCEINRDLLLSGMLHPIRYRHRLIIALHRYHLGWIGCLYSYLIQSFKSSIKKIT